jgi:(2S)-methylsuccinyl-CoA dehydrogenase
MATELLIDRQTVAAAMSPLTGATEAFRRAVAKHVRRGGLDAHQVPAYELAWATARLAAARAMVAWAESADSELAWAMAAAAVGDAVLRMQRFEAAARHYGVAPAAFDDGAVLDLLGLVEAPQTMIAIGRSIAEGADVDALGENEDHRQLRHKFRRFAQQAIAPRAQEIHRNNLDVPEDWISEAAGMGLFGFSVPAEFGGSRPGAPDSIAMLIATEELARGALLAGSLITRPEIAVRALLKAGTPEQKREWLPAIASGRKMVAVAVSERGFGSDVGGILCTAKLLPDGSWLVDGHKYWCGFAARADLMLLLCRTTEGAAHRGLSLFMFDKPRFSGREFEHRQPGGGMLSGRAIPTIGYRGMHTFELEFDGYVLPPRALVGGSEWMDKGFYLQMEGFSMSRLQTAGRAVGLMQAALSSAVDHARSRMVFGQLLFEYQLPLATLGRMAVRTCCARQLSYDAARSIDSGDERLGATLAKLYAARVAEKLTRDALQLHGGIGYSEESEVSRYFLDARLLPIFEGTDEVLALRVVAKSLLEA